MTDKLWMLLGLAFGPLACVAVVAFAGRRRRAALRALATRTFTPPADDVAGTRGVPKTIEEAERELGMVYRRLRAYIESPYDYVRSRIRDDKAFSDCLDLAANLNIRISDLVGAATPPGEEGRAQVRQQILDGLAGKAYSLPLPLPAAPAPGNGHRPPQMIEGRAV